MSSITSGPRNSIFKGKKGKIYKMVKNSIGEKWFKATMKHHLRGNNYAVHNASGKMVGFAIMGKNLPNMGGATYLHLIGAESGQGYGSQLLARIIQDAKRRKLKYIFLEPTKERVRIWYRRFGFKDVTPDLMALNLSKRLTPSVHRARSASVRAASRPASAARLQTLRPRTVRSASARRPS